MKVCVVLFLSWFVCTHAFADEAKFQLLSGRYFSASDGKEVSVILKIDTSTGQTWMLQNLRAKQGDVTGWLPVTEDLLDLIQKLTGKQ